jgi:tRNA (adenine22-N1)-methyltransferase
MVPEGYPVADIGTDHAYLPVYLCLTGRVPRAVASDIHADPWERARQTVADFRVERIVDVRLGEGLRVLNPGEVECVVIAGLGGHTIRAILEEGKQLIHGAKRLVLQPMTGSHNLRAYLVASGWHIVDELLVAEAGLVYEVLAAEPGKAEPLDWLEAEFGPCLLKKGGELCALRLRQAIAQRQLILANLDLSRRLEAAIKRSQLMLEVEAIEKRLRELGA